MVSNRQNSASQMVDAIGKVGGLIKDNKSNFDYMSLVPLGTQLLKDMTKGPDISKMFEVMGGMISPIIEVAAAAGGGGGGDGDDITGMINKVLGVMQKGIELTGKGQAVPLALPAPQPDAAQQAYALEAQRRQMIDAQQAQQAQQAKQIQAQAAQDTSAPKQETAPRRIRKKRKERQAQASADPMVTYARVIAEAIQDKNEDFRVLTLTSKDYLDDEQLELLAQYADPAMIGSYFGSLNGVDPSDFRTSYSKRWLKAFVVEFQETFGSPTPPETANPTATPEPVLVVDMSPEAATGNAPEPKTDKDKAIEEIKKGKFDYPDSSQLDIVDVEGFSLLVETISPEEVEKREAERLTMLERVKKEAPKGKKPRTVLATVDAVKA
jgi:hypothetical protein